MEPMRKGVARLLAGMFIASLLLVGCNGEELTEAEALADEFCDVISIFADIDEDDLDSLMEAMAELEQREDELLDLENRLIDSEIEDEELEAAVEARCPDALDAFDGF